jgi:peptide/nickel transport system substrate-binding protein
MSFKRAIITTCAFGLALTGMGAEVSFYDESLPTTLNPIYAKSMVDYRAQELYFDRLYYKDPITNNMVSRLAERWEVADGGRSIMLYLNPDIRWHDSKKFTANDICFTINAMLDERSASPQTESYRSRIDSCSKEGPTIAKITFKQPKHDLIEYLDFRVLPAHRFKSTAIQPDHPFGADPIGTGPFSGRVREKAARFEAHRNTSHHKPLIDVMKLSQGGDPQIQTTSVINGNVHGIVTVPPMYRPKLSSNSEISLKIYDLRAWWFVAVNTNKEVLAIPEVRQALNLIIDREDLREKIFGVKKGDKDSPCEFISGPFIPASPYYNQTVPAQNTPDLARANALLARAGLKKIGGRWHYKDQPVVLRIGMNATLDKEATDLYVQVANQFSEAGFDPRPTKISDDDWTHKVTTGKAIGDFDLVIGKWSFGLDENVTDLFYTRNSTDFTGTRNIFNYSNPEVDTILDEYINARTEDPARNAYQKLHSKLAEDLPYLFLWKLDTKSAWRKEIRNNNITPFFYFTDIDRWKFVK